MCGTFNIRNVSCYCLEYVLFVSRKNGSFVRSDAFVWFGVCCVVCLWNELSPWSSHLSSVSFISRRKNVRINNINRVILFAFTAILLLYLFKISPPKKTIQLLLRYCFAFFSSLLFSDEGNKTIYKCYILYNETLSRHIFHLILYSPWRFQFSV